MDTTITKVAKNPRGEVVLVTPNFKRLSSLLEPKIKCIDLFFSDHFCKTRTEEEISELFTSYDWSKMPLLRKISLVNENVTFLTKYLPPQVQKVVICKLHDMHNVFITSENIEEVIIENDSEEYYDSSFFDRLPNSVTHILLKIFINEKDRSLDYIYKNGFHNLPLSLKYFKIEVRHVEGFFEFDYTVKDEIKELIWKSITFGPNFEKLCLSNEPSDEFDISDEPDSDYDEFLEDLVLCDKHDGEDGQISYREDEEE